MSKKKDEIGRMKDESSQNHPSSLILHPSASRRDWLRQSALTGIGIGAALLGGAGCKEIQTQTQSLTGSTPPKWKPLPQDTSKTAIAVHVLNRAAYGPRPGDVARVVEMGAAAWLEEQLADGRPKNPQPKPQNQLGKLFPPQEEDTLGEDPAVTWRVNTLDTQQTEQEAPDELYSESDEQLLTETQQAATLRAIYSRHQLREVMADFWTNHFNIFAIKAEGRNLVPADTERVLRPHLLGNFRDLLKASAHSPAMLMYLDNQQNKNGVANENYAREILELHTLGVKSGYTLKDIQAVARCFTGWTVTTGFLHGKFEFNQAIHDDGAKYIPFLNLHIRPKGGQKDAETVLERLAAHPATARFLAQKLCRRFLGQMPDAAVEKAANAYLKNDGDIRAMLRPILLDSLLTPADCKPIVKRPLDYMVSALRALGADTNGGADLLHWMATMGQPLYLWPMPDGFPEKTSSWTGTLLPRWNFALALTSNAIPNTRVDLNGPLIAAQARTDDAILDTLLETVMGRPHTTTELSATREQARTHLQEARESGVSDTTALAETTALFIASPAFQWK